MPTAEHEIPVALARLDPDLPAWLLKNLFDAKVPDYDRARSHATDVRVMVPRTYHADSMTLLCDTDDRPVLATVLEVQRGWDLGKRRTWKLYVAQLEAELDVDAALLVYCPDPAISRRYRNLFGDKSLCLSLSPFIFTPEQVPLIVDGDVARARPSLTVLSAVCHGDPPEVEAAFPALMEALKAVGPKHEAQYYDVVLAGLSAAARTLWENFMTIAGYEFQSEFMRNLAAKYKAEARQEAAELVAQAVAQAKAQGEALGKAQGEALGKAQGEALGKAQGEALGKALGKAQGEAHAILVVLGDRGVAVPDDVRDQILECTDSTQVVTWLHRAITATTIDDVIRE